MKKLQLIALSLCASFATQAQNLNHCKNICEQTKIIESGPFLGIRFNCFPNSQNAVVLEVISNSCAEKNGILVNDVITSFDNVAITSNPQFMKLVASHQPGDKVNITYNHQGKTIQKNIKIGALTSKTITEKVCCDDLTLANKFSQSITISPNPAKSEVLLSSDIEMNGDLQIQIFTVTGQLVKMIKTKNEGNLFVNLNVSDIADGQYIMTIRSNNKVFNKSLLISK